MCQNQDNIHINNIAFSCAVYLIPVTHTCSDWVTLKTQELGDGTPPPPPPPHTHTYSPLSHCEGGSRPQAPVLEDSDQVRQLTKNLR